MSDRAEIESLYTVEELAEYWRVCTRTIRRPSTCGASWPLIVSTSGSSGIRPAYAAPTNGSPGSSSAVRPPSETLIFAIRSDR